MRIAIITRYRNYPKGCFPGGDETVHHMIESTLVAHGHTVDFIGTDDAKVYYHNNCLLKIFNGRFLLIEPPYLGRYFDTIKHKYDVVICNGEYGSYIRHQKIIIIYHFSSLGYKENNLWKVITVKDIVKLKIFTRLYNFNRRQMLEIKAAKGHIIVAVSQYLKQYLVRQGIQVDHIIPNAVDTEKFKPLLEVQKQGDYLFVGRYDYIGKGFDVLINLVRRGLKIDCYTNIDSLGVLNMKGVAKNEDMPLIYNSYNILIFSSRFESSGMVPIEAMSCGLPIVMSNVGIGPELKKAIPEFVVDGWDNTACNEYIKHIQIIKNNYEYYSKKAREYVVEKHSLGIFESNWLSLIDQIN